MCGRYTLASEIREFVEQLAFDFDVPAQLHHPRRYNVAPGQPVLGLVADPKPHAEVMLWGFVPSWVKPGAEMRPAINARAETIEEKAYFRGAFRSSRCAILADGFYEWRKAGRAKQPYRITMSDRRVFAMAGLWSWHNQGDGTEQATCTIITTEPNELMSGIHDRMPVIFDPAEASLWLDPRATARELRPLLRSYPAEGMRAYEVGHLVNSAANDIPGCIESLGAE